MSLLTLRSNYLLDYSKLEYVNTTDDYMEIKNGEKLLVFVFSIKKGNLYHSILISNVVKNGKTIFYGNNNQSKRVYVDTMNYSNGYVNKYIDNSKYLSWCNKIVNEPLSEGLQKFIAREIVYFTVRIPSNKLLQEIREHKIKISLKLLCILRICSLELPKYNNIHRNYVISY